MTFIKKLTNQLQCANVATPEAEEKRMQKKFDKNLAFILNHQQCMLTDVVCTQKPVPEVPRKKVLTKRRSTHKNKANAKRINLQDAIILCQL